MENRPEINLLLEEYRALRQEVAAALQAQHSVLSWGIAALALLVIAIADAWDKTPTLISAALMTILPGGIYLLLVVWGMEVTRMTRAGAYVAGYLEPRINSAAELADPTLVWEQWLALPEAKPASQRFREWIVRKNSRSRNLWFSHAAIVAIFAFLAATSWGVGAYRFHDLATRAAHQRAHGDLTWYFDNQVVELVLLGLVFFLLPLFTGIWMLLDGRKKYEATGLPRNPHVPVLRLQLGPPSDSDNSAEDTG